MIASADWCNVGRSQVDINILPDDVLLEIFADYMYQAKWMGAWCKLVHVCRTWRLVVFSSSRRLNLQIICTARSPVRALDIWPAYPIVILGRYLHRALPSGMDNIISALKHRDRVRHIELRDPGSLLLGIFAAEIQEPLPELTVLELRLGGIRAAPVLPDSFSIGPQPRLQKLHLRGIPLLPVRKLLLSAIDLIYLDLWDIPYCEYTSDGAMITCLAAMTRLESLSLGFCFPRSGPASRRPPPPTHIIFPALTHFKFRGVSETLEDLVVRIDTPLLDKAEITFFNQLLYEMPRLSQFIGRANKFKVFDQAHVLFQHRYVQVGLSSQAGTVDHGTIELRILCQESDWQLSSLAQVCHWLPPYSTIERLDIREDGRPYCRTHWQDDLDNTQWTELFRPFTAVKDLHLSEEPVLRVALALQEPFGAEVLPVLQNIFLEVPESSDLVRAAAERFIAAQQFSGHKVTVLHDISGRVLQSFTPQVEIICRCSSILFCAVYCTEVDSFQPDLLSLVIGLIREHFAQQFLCVVHSPLGIFPTLDHPDFVPSMARTRLRRSG